MLYSDDEGRHPSRLDAHEGHNPYEKATNVSEQYLPRTRWHTLIFC